MVFFDWKAGEVSWWSLTVARGNCFFFPYEDSLLFRLEAGNYWYWTRLYFTSLCSKPCRFLYISLFFFFGWKSTSVLKLQISSTLRNNIPSFFFFSSLVSRTPSSLYVIERDFQWKFISLSTFIRESRKFCWKFQTNKEFILFPKRDSMWVSPLKIQLEFSAWNIFILYNFF